MGKVKEAIEFFYFYCNKKNNIYYQGLKSSVQAIHIKLSDSDESSAREWKKFMLNVKRNILRGDLANFLHWKTIRLSMFVEEGESLQKELDYLRNCSEWTRYKVLLRESIVGNPIAYSQYPISSGNLIHHTYQVAYFEEHTDIKLDEFDVVFEFGGGYGSMARVFQNASFKGKYIVFDTPLFSALQKYYLQCSDYKIESVQNFDNVESGIFCISDKNELFEVLAKINPTAKNCFWATWSFSETPISLREEFAPHLAPFNYQFIAYQDKFMEASNKPYFLNYVDKFKQLESSIVPFDFMVGQSFLIMHPKNV